MATYFLRRRGRDLSHLQKTLTKKGGGCLRLFLLLPQFWTDEFLQWTPEDFDNITKLSIPTDSIWVPDILINEL